MTETIEVLRSAGVIAGASGVLALLLLVVAAVVVMRGIDKDSDARPRRVVGVVFSLLAGLILLIVALVPDPDRWVWVLALLPAAFVIHNGVHVAVFKNRRFFKTWTAPDFSLTRPELVPFIKAAELEEERYYSTPSLLLRFALPAVVLTLACLTVGYTLIAPPAWINDVPDRRFLHGAQFGALGGYVYVVIFLGGRAGRCDLTPGSVVWSTVTIVAGPMLAGSLQILFVGSTGDSWASFLLPFAAGFSLRFIVDFVDASIRRVFGGANDAAVRRTPLVRLRGISREIEERLAEEGVTDVAMLARANPYRLRRNMALDKRQITSWIDEAILMTFLPNAWEALTVDGVAGASHLVWYIDGNPGEAVAEMSDGIRALATRNKLDDGMLHEVARRLSRDPQVCLVQALHQLDDSEAGEDASLFRNFRAEAAESAESSTADPRSVPEGPSDETGPAVDPTRAIVPVAEDLESERHRRYASHQNLFLTHAARRSRRRGQRADVMLRLVEHSEGVLARGLVRRVEYQLGDKFSVTPIEKTDARDGFALALSVYGPVLCVARVSFTDGRSSLLLERYIDFELDGPDASGATGGVERLETRA